MVLSVLLAGRARGDVQGMERGGGAELLRGGARAFDVPLMLSLLVIIRGREGRRKEEKEDEEADLATGPAEALSRIKRLPDNAPVGVSPSSGAGGQSRWACSKHARDCGGGAQWSHIARRRQTPKPCASRVVMDWITAWLVKSFSRRMQVVCAGRCAAAALSLVALPSWYFVRI